MSRTCTTICCTLKETPRGKLRKLLHLLLVLSVLLLVALSVVLLVVLSVLLRVVQSVVVVRLVVVVVLFLLVVVLLTVVVVLVVLLERTLWPVVLKRVVGPMLQTAREMRLKELVAESGALSAPEGS